MVLAVLLAAATLETMSPEDVWGGRERRPAVVNPPVAEPSENVLSLSGEWDFVTRGHHCGGIHQQEWWRTDYEPNHSYRKIHVPGNWETQGVGEQGCGTHHLNIDMAPKELRHAFTGEGLYRKKVKVPAEWAGKRIWLKIGGVNCRGYFAIGERFVGMLTAHAGAWKYEVTDIVKPGEEATIYAMVDNAVGSRNSQPGNAHRWGGITRDIELEATPKEVWIDDAWVRGDFDTMSALAMVTLGGDTNLARVVAAIPQNLKPWSPECPNLYTARIDLVSLDGKVMETRYERFGVRKFEVRGKEFYLNGKPFYIRGFGDDSTYPITGSSPCDRAYHRAHLARAKAAGFNFVRLHTHSEMPEYMDACDELGIIVQSELSYYFDMPMDHFDYNPKRDIDERFIAYRRHASWCVASGGNEGKVGPAAGGLIYDYLKRTDPERLVQEQDGPSSPDDFGRPIEDFCTGPMRPWQRGAFDPPMPFICHEYLNLSVKQDSRLENKFTGAWMPLETRKKRAERLAAAGLTHDWGDCLQDAQHNLQAALQKNGIERARLDPYCDGYCYWTIVDVGVENTKLGVFTAQGLFDVFWEPKSCGATVESFAVFNSPTCVLGDFCEEAMPTNAVTNYGWDFTGKWSRLSDTNRVFTTGETIAPMIALAHYGEATITEASLEWALKTNEGQVLANGNEDIADQALGGVRNLKRLKIKVPRIEHPCAAKLSATVLGRVNGVNVRYANDWEVYLFPERKMIAGNMLACSDALYETLAPRYLGIARTSAAEKRPIVICEANSPEENEAIKDGRSVITLAGQTGKANFALGWWWIGNQVGTFIKPHAVLGDFPTGKFLSPLYYRIIKTGTTLPQAGVTEKNLVIAGEGGKEFFLYLSVEELDPNSNPKKGARRVRIAGLDVLSPFPEGINLLDNAVNLLLLNSCRSDNIR